MTAASRPMFPARPTALVPANALICPRCGKPLPRVTAGEGYFLATCDRKITSGRLRDSCNQHVYVWGHGHGAATIIPITRDEAELLEPAGVTHAPGEALAILRILRERSLDAVPVLECADCHTPTRKSDLFQGVCRWCVAEAPQDPA